MFLKPRWIIAHIVVIFLAVLFTNFGFWQLRRLEQRQTRNTLLETRLGLEPEPLQSLLNQFDTTSAPAEETSIAFRPTRVSGTFDPEYEILRRSSDNYDGQPGYYVMSPLVLDDGQALLVERGWVPFDMDTPPVMDALPPEGRLELTGIINLPITAPTDWRRAFSPQDPMGELNITAYTDTVRLGEQMPYTLLPVTMQLKTQTPEQASVLPLPFEEPEFTDGSHLGYAIQWFSFVVIGVVGYGFLMRQAVLSDNQP